MCSRRSATTERRSAEQPREAAPTYRDLLWRHSRTLAQATRVSLHGVSTRWLVAVLAAGGIAFGVAVAGQAAAHQRCEDHLPGFPVRVTDVAVDWRLSKLDYDCLYRTYHGGEIRR